MRTIALKLGRLVFVLLVVTFLSFWMLKLQERKGDLISTIAPFAGSRFAGFASAGGSPGQSVPAIAAGFAPLSFSVNSDDGSLQFPTGGTWDSMIALAWQIGATVGDYYECGG